MAAGLQRSAEEGSAERGSAAAVAVDSVKTLAKDAESSPPPPLDAGVPRMTAASLLECCRASKGWEVPELNDVLCLHFKGFRRIENLGAYHGVKSLFLESNGISKLENLEVMLQLVSLYLQNNNIRQIENLDSLANLRYLNLSHNSLERIDGLAGMLALETLNCSKNKITEVDGLRGLGERPSLKSIDVSGNYFEEGDKLLEFWPEHAPQVECLYIHHNPCSRDLKDGRRRLISGLPELKWLDERPVTEVERIGCTAWATEGSRDAEMHAKAAFWIKEREDKEKSFYAFKRLQEAHAERCRAQREAEGKHEAARKLAEDELTRTGELGAERTAEGWRVADASRAAPRPGDSAAVSEKQEPVRAAELKAKVAAFLASRKGAAEAAPSGRAPEDKALDAAELEAEAEADAEDESAEDESAAVAVEAPREPRPFTWSSFKDRRLGSLVNECRRDFQRVAQTLSEEFDCDLPVGGEECRARYRELCRPASRAPAAPSQDESGDKAAAEARRESARASIEKDKGRAKDQPKPEAADVQEVSDWWRRKIAKGKDSGDAAKKFAPVARTKAAAKPWRPVSVDDEDEQGDESADWQAAPAFDGARWGLAQSFSRTLAADGEPAPRAGVPEVDFVCAAAAAVGAAAAVEAPQPAPAAASAEGLFDLD